MKKAALAGSERKPLGNRIGDESADQKIEVSVVLKPKTRAPAPGELGATVSRQQFAEKYGADPAVVEQIKALAKEYNLTVTDVSLARRTVQLTGTARDIERAFDVHLARYEYEGREYRGRTGDIQVPADLADSIEAVLGLDNRPQARTHFRVRGQGRQVRATQKGISYSPVQVAQLYQFPTDVNGAGETVGIIELGGGYKTADLKNYFSSLGLAEPTVKDVLVDKAKNDPTNANSADGEVLLDIEVAGAVAPGAKIVVYFAPNTDQGFQDALTTAIHDSTNKPSVISISWGGAESTWTGQAMTAFDSAAQDAAALGVTICAASGDNGSSDGVSSGDHVDFPASSPHILACGGTSLQSSNGKITSETVWNDGTQGGASGGGYSAQFPLPSWQSGAKIAPPAGLGRGVPDVAGDADPQTGYNVLVDGEQLVIGGTSAVAPLWSGLIALLNQKLGKPVGYLQPALYGIPGSADAFHDITSGSNGAYSASPGWDPVTGLGSPSGGNLAKALSAGTTPGRKKHISAHSD